MCIETVAPCSAVIGWTLAGVFGTQNNTAYSRQPAAVLEHSWRPFFLHQSACSARTKNHRSGSAVCRLASTCSLPLLTPGFIRAPSVSLINSYSSVVLQPWQQVLRFHPHITQLKYNRKQRHCLSIRVIWTTLQHCLVSGNHSATVLLLVSLRHFWYKIYGR